MQAPVLAVTGWLATNEPSALAELRGRPGPRPVDGDRNRVAHDSVRRWSSY